MNRATTTPNPGQRQELRTPEWSDLPRAAQMVARAYLRAPAGHLPRPARRLLEALVSIAFYVSLAVYRPLVRYWRDPNDPRRQIVVSIIPNRARALPVFRLLVGLTAASVVLLGTTELAYRSAIAAAVLLILIGAASVVTLALLTASLMAVWPYHGRILRPGPGVPGTDLTAGLAASTAPAGMRAVRAHLLAHHHGQRLTVTARDAHARAVYGRLGLTVVTAGRGRMTGIVGQEPGAPTQP